MPFSQTTTLTIGDDIVLAQAVLYNLIGADFAHPETGKPFRIRSVRIGRDRPRIIVGFDGREQGSIRGKVHIIIEGAELGRTGGRALGVCHFFTFYPGNQITLLASATSQTQAT